jgi:hypothetical protein
MRRSLLALIPALAVLAMSASPSSAATTSFSGTLLVHQPLKKDTPFPCAGPGVCGTGTLRGIGPVHVTIDEDEFTPIPGTDCFSNDRSETVTVLDGSGTIALTSTGIACTPGRSQTGPHEKSYGNPFFFDLTFTVDGANSSGAYQGATGAGSELFQFAGATGKWMLSGTLTTT